MRDTPLLLLHDQPGSIVAYKLVNGSGEGPYNGGIKYEVGKVARVNKKDACTDVNTRCGSGISLATLDWCMANWQEGYRILMAEFTAKDIAAIPTATDGKFRVFRCEITGERT